MTVGDSRWPLYCFSSPLLPVLWHFLQLNVATTTPHFYVVHLLGPPWWRKLSTLPSKTLSTKFPALPLVTCPKYCSFIRAIFPINSLSRPISSNKPIYWYGVPSNFCDNVRKCTPILIIFDCHNKNCIWRYSCVFTSSSAPSTMSRKAQYDLLPLKITEHILCVSLMISHM